ncbi:hypothetical protein ACFOD4_15650 [Pseudoroseomonas globiformis]|uniref:Uncharacterized protein n=1 Tax=Teichococcus globiformis TaxID=2307229 RepID=A0ABV7G1C7_9PROT
MPLVRPPFGTLATEMDDAPTPAQLTLHGPTIAVAVYAPVANRFLTYDVELEPA